jgi:sec-independent protein translocase protein TatB
MFDVGFSEILVIAVIALLVLGPQKLPKLAADVGRWVGRARAMARQLRDQLDQEVNLEEFHRTNDIRNATPAAPAAPAAAPTEDAGGKPAARAPQPTESPASAASGHERTET